MKNVRIPLTILFLVFVSCKGDPKNVPEKDRTPKSTAELTENTPVDSKQEKTPPATKTLTGTFIRNENTSTKTCNCNCVEIHFEKATSLCLDTKSRLSILARYEKASNSKVNVYYVKPENTENINDTKLPWDKFDTTKTIATIVYAGDDTFELDWKGFTIDGEIATDYAIFGKKNLEGGFVRKQ